MLLTLFAALLVLISVSSAAQAGDVSWPSDIAVMPSAGGITSEIVQLPGKWDGNNLKAEKTTSEDFVADANIQQIAEAYALDAVDFADRNFGMTLDWTDASVEKVEEIADLLYRQSVKAKPSAEQILLVAKMLGSYIGEVFRRNHGGAWGMVTLEGQSFPGMRASNGGALFWPWGKARDRITNGAEDNLWRYYQWLLKDPGP